MGLHQDLQRVTYFLGIGELLGPRLEIPEGLQPLKESLSEECLHFFVFRGHSFDIGGEGGAYQSINMSDGARLCVAVMGGTFQGNSPSS